MNRTKKTDYFVICEGEDWEAGIRSTKEARAMELNARGCNIKIILEKQFFSMFPERQSHG